MNLKLKFLQQQILTVAGMVGLATVIFISIYNNEYWLLLLSFLYSQIVVSLFGTQIILHRYFSHRSFQINGWLHDIFCLLSILPGQGSPIAWTAAHRHHHKHSDSTFDNHSPTESYFLAAGGWLLKGYRWIVEVKKLKTVPVDLLRDKKLVLLDQHYYNIWFFLVLTALVINFKFAIFFIIAPVGWNLLLSALVTLGCHVKAPYNYRNFDTNDNTHNNLFLQLIVLGDALHNNHHRFPNEYTSKIKNNEFDVAGEIITLIRKS
jgi:stearoyl-CoA desaturase (Delta-9 desaturase)